MTIAISLKVNDGVILATDSAASFMGRTANGGTAIFNIYNTANKIFNLRKGIPIGAITWGAGSIGNASTSTLLKDLRKRFSGKAISHKDWHLDPDNYSVEKVADRLKEFIFDELYVPAFQDWPEKPYLGFIVAGFSADKDMAEEFQINIQNGVCNGPSPVRSLNECGASWSGEPEAINRLMLGFGGRLPELLVSHLGVTPQDLQSKFDVLKSELLAPLVMPAMPIQDAIDLAEFLVYLTIQFSRFSPGAPTVGGPVEIAAITKHEGYKWAARKHYFDREFNLEA